MATNAAAGRTGNRNDHKFTVVDEQQQWENNWQKLRNNEYNKIKNHAGNKSADPVKRPIGLTSGKY